MFVQHSANIAFLTSIVDTLVDLEKPANTEHRDTTRTLYARQICNAFRAIFDATTSKTFAGGAKFEKFRLLPAAAAAAVGKVRLFLNSVSKVSDIVAVHVDSFPNALDAAVAAGQTEMVKTILWYMVQNTHGPWKLGKSKEMRTTGRVLYNALGLAIRLHQNNIGDLICLTLSENKHIKNSILTFPNKYRYSYDVDPKALLKDCIMHSNVHFLVLASHFARGEVWPSADDTLEQPTLDDMEVLLKSCPKSMLGPLVRQKMLDLNVFGQNTTIWVCMRLGRRDLVKALLELGADINSEPPGGGCPAFWRATKEERFDDAEFLFQQGASVQPWMPKRKSQSRTQDKKS